MSNTETSSFQFVVGRRNGAGAAEVGDDGAGPEGGDFAGNLILIPTVAAAGLPDGAGHAAVNFLDEGLLNFRTDFQDALLPAFHQLHAIHGVTNLGFDHENDGIVAQSGVGAEKHEEIREASDSYAEIGGHPFAPGIVNFYAALPHQAAPNERLGGAETGAVNQDVNRTLDTIARDDAVLADFGDAFSDEFDVRTDSLPRKPRTRNSCRQKINWRKAQRVMGMLRKRLFHFSLKAKSRRGTIHGGVRWKRWSWPTRGAICGTNWIALAPVPTTATFLPSRSTL